MTTWKDNSDVVEFVRMAKHYSATIEADINDAFEDVETLEEFKESVKSKMDNLITEAGGIMSLAEVL